MEKWYTGDGSDVKALYSHTLQPSAHRGKITSYFQSLVQGNKEVSPLTCEFQPRHTLVWMDGYKQDRVKLLKQLTAPNMKQFRVLIVSVYDPQGSPLREIPDKTLWLWFNVYSTINYSTAPGAYMEIVLRKWRTSTRWYV